MDCQYLRVYRAASGTWSVHTCTARRTPYVPSLSEVNSYCNTSRSQGCSHGRRLRQRADKPAAGLAAGMLT